MASRNTINGCALSGGFHTVWGGIDPWYHRLDSRVGGVVHVRKYFKSGGETISSPGGAGPRRWSEGQLSPRAGSTTLSQSATSQWPGLDFHTMRGGIDPEDHRFRPRVVGVVDIWKNFFSGDRTLSSPSPPALHTNTSQSAIRWWGWFSTPCEAMSNRGNSVFVPGLSELHMYGRISDPGMGTIPPQGKRALCTSPS